MELKARFDEERNIKWARRLEKAGCHVIYGLRGLKVHCKCLLIIRREESGIKRYLHFGTGNYNSTTAKQYTDLSYLTSDIELGIDTSTLFNMLTGFTRESNYKKLVPAPILLREKFYKLIDREIENMRKGEKGRIIAKMNSLVDRGIIEKLYDASKEGVRIDLVVRGACCLRPGIDGISSNISVRSVIGRYLEHSRIYYFYNGGVEDTYISSADWMERNLNSRVEILVPIEDREAKVKIYDILKRLLKDEKKARILESSGKYSRNLDGTYSAQDEFLNIYQ